MYRATHQVGEWFGLTSSCLGKIASFAADQAGGKLLKSKSTLHCYQSEVLLYLSAHGLVSSSQPNIAKLETT